MLYLIGQIILTLLFTFVIGATVGWLLRDQYHANEDAAQVNARTLILAAERDAVIPARHAQRLAEAFNSTSHTFVMVPASSHDNISDSRLFHDSLRAFVE